MIGASDVISDGLRSLRTQEDCARVTHPCGKRLLIHRHYLQMLRRNLVHELNCFFQIINDDDRAVLRQRRLNYVRARETKNLGLNFSGHKISESIARRQKYRRRFLVVLCLGQQVCGDVVCARRLIGNNHDFARPGDRIDADGTEDVLLCRCNVLIARSCDLIHAWDRLCAKGECPDGLCSAD